MAVFAGVLLWLASASSLAAQSEADDRAQHLEIAVGPVAAASVAYTRLFEDIGVRGGIRLSYSYEENTKTFGHNVWEVFGIDIFGRRVVNPEVHVDVGLSLWGFAPEDDTDDTGTFAGAYGAAFFGHRFLFAGLELRGGVSSLYDATELGIIASPRLKLLFKF